MDCGKTCCVTGHRDLPADGARMIKKRLEEEVRAAVEDGYTHFMSGFAEGADLMFADIVLKFKKKYPNITLEAAVPYAGRMKTPNPEFQRLIKLCDEVKVHSPVYQKSCYMQRNRYMVNNSQRVIAVYDGRATGGTAATVRYALSMEREVRYIQY